MFGQRSRTLIALLPCAVALTLLLAAYLPTLQKIPNGSEHYYMIDVGETQIVLNVWGTLHATGYPLYVMIGSTAVTIMKAFGISAATAPGVVSLLWGVMALAVMYALALRTSRRPLAAATMIVLFGLTRTVWVHHVIAEIYTMTLFLQVGLLLIALWTPPVKGRIYWLALVGGIALAHHRALLVLIPALIYAVYPDLIALIRRRPLHLILLLLLGLVGLIPYGYLMLRANAGAPWVYGEPGTLQGLWDQFMGVEASRFIGLPNSLEAVIANFQLVTNTILTDITALGLILGVVGLITGAMNVKTRRAAVTIMLTGSVAYLFHCLVYTDILSALILAVTFSLAFGWFFLADNVLAWAGGLTSPRLTEAQRPLSYGEGGQAQRGGVASLPAPSSSPLFRFVTSAAILVMSCACAVGLVGVNQGFVSSLTKNRSGIETIAMAQHTPPGSTLMLAWGPRYFAVGFARSVMGSLPGVTIVDHKANFRTLLTRGSLVTPSYTFYRQSEEWWEAQIGGPVYLHAVAPDLIEISTTPERAPNVSAPGTQPDGISVYTHRVTCTAVDYVLEVSWLSSRTPQRDLSVFVHLVNREGMVRAQNDQGAPVYGWRPVTTWAQGEIIRDVYTLPRLSDAVRIRYGLYTQHEDGSFENVLEMQIPATCGA